MSKIKQYAEDAYGEDWVEKLEDKGIIEIRDIPEEERKEDEK